MEPSISKSVPQDDVPTRPASEDSEIMAPYVPSCSSGAIIEYIQDYRQGGFHPVHLGDCFDNERFRVVHKLGAGHSATVWLARDALVNGYVALKFCMAEKSETSQELAILEFLNKQESDHPGKKHLPSLRSHFTVEGPNGSHLCLVTTVSGPSIKDLLEWGRRLPADKARKVAHQATQALAYLHSLGVCHGDFTGYNVLLQLADFDSWTDEQLYDRLGQPWTARIERWSEEPPEPTAPRYTVEPIDFSKLGSPWLTSDIQVVGFGKAFYALSPPPRLSTALDFLAPESFFELKFGVRSDDWALACVIFMIRSEDPLLHIPYYETRSFAVDEIVATIGAPPGLWNKMSIDDEGMPRNEEQIDSGGKVVPWVVEGEPLKNSLIQRVTDIEAEVEPIDFTSVQVANRERRELRDQVELESILRPRDVLDRPHWMERVAPEYEGAWNLRKLERSLAEDHGGRSVAPEDEGACNIRKSDIGMARIEKEEERHRKALKISSEEARSLYDLLSKILRYDPEERISTEEIERHEWFVREFPYTGESV